MPAPYTLADHPYLPGPLAELFEQLRQRIFELDPNISIDVYKGYIAFVYVNHFVDVLTRSRSLRVLLGVPFNLLDDPRRACTNLKGTWGYFESEFVLTSPAQLAYCMALVQQAFIRDTKR